ncbi:6-bladed beta-propeller [Tangfeifania diversioriginum]|nr:6-bladed beta-propeller [Tangfeifania diversioriginum]
MKLLMGKNLAIVFERNVIIPCLFVIVIYLFLMIGYNKSVSAQEQVVINPKINCNNEILFSDLFADINYIPLETKIENLISEPSKVRITDSLIFIKNHKPPALLVFNYSGNFIAKIGREGRGPAEYNWLRSFCIDEKNRHVFIYNKYPDKLLIYNYDGTFVKSHSYKKDIYMNDIEFFSDDKYVLMRDNRNGETPFSYEFYTSNHQLIEKKIKPLSFSMKGSFGLTEAFSYYAYNNIFIVKENLLNDTLYSISESLEFVPRYVFNFGRLTFPVEVQINSWEIALKAQSNGWESGSEMDKYIMPAGIFETHGHIILCYRLNEKFHWGYYNKKTKKACSYKNWGIRNDYDGGPDFHPIYQKNTLMLGFIHAYEFIEHVNSKAFKNSTPKYPEKKKELEKLANSLDENDNPVLMLVKLKE